MDTSRALLPFIVVACLGAVGCAERTSSPPPATSSASSPAPAQPGTGQGSQASGGRIYDTSTVETTRGKVESVKQVTSKGTPRGVHLIMSTDDGAKTTVHLGPAWFVESHSFTIREGDTLEVTGSRVTVAGAPALVARAVKKGEDELVLRDEAGVPMWSAARDPAR